MATETPSTELASTNETTGILTRDLLLRYLRQNGYKPLKEDSLHLPDKKEGILAVAKHGRKELIDVKGLPVFFPVQETAGAHARKTDLLLNAMQSVAEALLFSFINVGKYFKEEKIASALALPDTDRYRQIIEKLEDYFTENNLDFKIYLVAENGTVREQNLNQKFNRDGAVAKGVVQERNSLQETDEQEPPAEAEG